MSVQSIGARASDIGDGDVAGSVPAATGARRGRAGMRPPAANRHRSLVLYLASPMPQAVTPTGLMAPAGVLEDRFAGRPGNGPFIAGAIRGKPPRVMMQFGKNSSPRPPGPAMAARQSLEDKLAAIRGLRGQELTPEQLAELKRRIGDRSNLVVAAAAAIAGENSLVEMARDLEVAFDRF